MLKQAKAFSSFSVDDVASAKRFYGEILGLDVRDTPEGLALDLNGVSAFLYPKPNHQPATFTVLNFSVENVDEAVAALKQRGVKFESYDLPGLKTDADNIARGGKGPMIAWFTDPAGNILSVLQPRG